VERRGKKIAWNGASASLSAPGQLDAREAQRAIADDWTEAYADSSMSPRQTLG